jgi:hypothetical protein
MLEQSASAAAVAKTKKTKLSQIDKQSDSGRRLVEYFLVVSSVEREDSDNASSDGVNVSFDQWRTESYDEDDESIFSEHKFKPVVTARYPLTDHADNPLHDNVTFFCHPSGGIQLRLEEYMPKVSETFEKVSKKYCVYLYKRYPPSFWQRWRTVASKIWCVKPY